MTVRLSAHRGPRVAGLLAAAALAAVAGCTSGHAQPPATPHGGGTLHYLRPLIAPLTLDPQRNAVAGDQAFASGFLQRTLTAWSFGTGPAANHLVPDLATDTGRVSDHATTWSFTLRPGVSFQTGQPIRCADIKYGVSRAFAGATLPGALTAPVAMLDIPTDAHGLPVYKGPYAGVGNDTAAFDHAVQCSPDQRTITFHLNRPVADFGAVVATLSYSPVPRAADTRANYAQRPVSSGPYEIARYQPDARLLLVRNPHWHKASDPYRPAYPDRIVVSLNVTDATIQQRLTSTAAGEQADLTASLSQPLAVAFAARPATAARLLSGPSGYVDTLAINTARVPNLAQRQAIVVALDVSRMNTAAGGPTAGTLADGLVSPALAGYAPTGLRGGLLGTSFDASGDPSLARRLISSSGRTMPALTLDYLATDHSGQAGIVVSSLARAGIVVRPRPLPLESFYPTVVDPATAGDLILGPGTGSDWLTASSALADQLTPDGTQNFSQYDNPALTGRLRQADALLDPDARAAAWAEINTTAVRQAVAVPLRYESANAVVGARVGGAYLWSPYGSLPFGALWVNPPPPHPAG